MAAITQIVETEETNKDTIHLYREGLFLKAYQHSAFMFISNVKNFRTVKKYYKSVDANVVMLGFPSGNLERLFPGAEFTQLEEGHYSVPCPAGYDEKSYDIWFDSIELSPEKKKVRKPDIFPPESSEESDERLFSVRLYEKDSANAEDTRDEVIRELHGFSIENATPMECMLFISSLKSKLKKGGGLR